MLMPDSLTLIMTGVGNEYMRSAGVLEWEWKDGPFNSLWNGML
jgi:hypothetical protein